MARMQIFKFRSIFKSIAVVMMMIMIFAGGIDTESCSVILTGLELTLQPMLTSDTPQPSYLSLVHAEITVATTQANS